MGARVMSFDWRLSLRFDLGFGLVGFEELGLGT